MKDEKSKISDMLRQRYLNEYRNMYRENDRLAFFKEIREIAAEHGLPVWEKFAIGMTAYVKKEFNIALSLFEEVISFDPECAFAWNGIGSVYSLQRRYNEALSAYETAISFDSGYAAPWNGKGNVFFRQKRYDEALAAYEKSIMCDPKFVFPWNGKGNVLTCQKRYDEALAAYVKSLSLVSEYASSWNNMGNIYFYQKRYDEALAAYDKSISCNSKYAAPWNNKGIVLFKKKQYDEALEAYKKSVSIEFDFAEPHYNIGLLYWELGKLAEAKDAFQLALEFETDPDSKAISEGWIERVRRMIAAEKAGKSIEERTKEDRATDAALITELYKAMEDYLPDIREKKIQFDNRIAMSVGKSRIIGESGTDNMFCVLRDWNSFSPILRKDVRGEDSKGPDERSGGGYFLVWNSHGIVIDPGLDFVTQLYKKGFSISDVDTVIITHCHLDHIRDVESLVDLNYRYNKAKGYDPHDNPDKFRQLHFFMCESAFKKYDTYLQNTGCCLVPEHLSPGIRKIISKGIAVKAVHAFHKDVNGRSDEAIGLVFTLKQKNKIVVRIGLTSDTRWDNTLPASYKNCHVLVTHLGTIEVGDEKKDTKKGEDAPSEGGFLKTTLSNHLGSKGCFRLMHTVKPKLFIIGEFGEELVETRFKIVQVLHKLRPEETICVLGGDSNLTVGLGESLSILCSHHECAQSRIRIPLKEVKPVLGEDFLFQYFCPQHSIMD